MAKNVRIFHEYILTILNFSYFSFIFYHIIIYLIFLKTVPRFVSIFSLHIWYHLFYGHNIETSFFVACAGVRRKIKSYHACFALRIVFKFMPITLNFFVNISNQMLWLSIIFFFLLFFSQSKTKTKMSFPGYSVDVSFLLLGVGQSNNPEMG